MGCRGLSRPWQGTAKRDPTTEMLWKRPSRFREGSRSTTILRKVRWDREARDAMYDALQKSSQYNPPPLVTCTRGEAKFSAHFIFDRPPAILWCRVLRHKEDVQRMPSALPLRLRAFHNPELPFFFSLSGTLSVLVAGWLSHPGLVLYVADTNNHRLRKISGDVANGAGTVTCLAGR